MTSSILTPDQAEAYRREGFLFPFRAFDASEAARYLRAFDGLIAREGADVWSRTKLKPYLLVTWLNELIRTAAILDAVEGVLGPDILAWVVGVFAKGPRDPSFLNWHQDSTYWGLSEPAVVTAWVALTPSTPANGCMRVVPGSHRAAQLPHRDTFAANSVLSRGQEVAVAVDEAAAVDVVLQPGEFSLHHVMTVHGSEPNRSDTRRVGIAIRYVAPQVRHVDGSADSATLVRGRDAYGHFLAEPHPRCDFDPDAVAFYRRVVPGFQQRKEAIAAAGQGTGRGGPAA